MTPEPYQEVGRLYRSALELEPARWAAYLAEACGGDAALRREVESPLAYDARQARGEKADARTDIFSLGVMIYEMIVGRAPFVLNERLPVR